MSYRIGQGLDVHAFGEGNHVMLGGVRITHNRGLVAHSDGDVAIHALCDAMLGAVALGDIGQHFPPDDERWRNAGGARLLGEVSKMLTDQGWCPVNIDLTIVCESPTIGPHVHAMREALAAILEIPASGVSVKATTTEKLGFCGRGEGITAMAIVLVQAAE